MALVQDLTVIAQLLFLDRDGGSAAMMWRYPSSATLDEIIADITDKIPYVQAISNAVIKRVKISITLEDNALGEPDINSSCSTNLLLFYRNGEDFDVISVPSPSPLLLETSGSYSGIRVDYNDAGTKALIDALSEALVNTVDTEGNPFDKTFYVGGYAQ